MEDYFERVVERLTGAGYRWYETANFCRPVRRPSADYRAQHNLAYWLGRDYLGVGVGAVSTIAGERRRNPPGLAALRRGARGRSAPAARDSSSSTPRRRSAERVMLGLRLDEPLALAGLESAVDGDGARAARAPRARAASAPRRTAVARADARAAASSAAASPPSCSPERPAGEATLSLQMRHVHASDRPPAADPPPRRRAVRDDRAAGRLEGRSSSAASWASRRPPSATSSPTLESLGLLMHPHTSAGRVPTERGYRLYAGTRARPARGAARARSRST